MTARVLGIDISTARTGVALPDGTTHSILPRVEVTKTSPCTVRVRRVADIGTQLALLLRRHQLDGTNVDVATVEGYLLAGPGGPWVMIRLVEVGLMVRFVLDQLRIPFVEIPPSTLKRWATGGGGADKHAMELAAREHGGTPANHDEADAYLLRSMGVAWYGDWDALTREQLDVLGRYPWPELERARG